MTRDLFVTAACLVGDCGQCANAQCGHSCDHAHLHAHLRERDEASGVTAGDIREIMTGVTRHQWTMEQACTRWQAALASAHDACTLAEQAYAQASEPVPADSTADAIQRATATFLAARAQLWACRDAIAPLKQACEMAEWLLDQAWPTRDADYAAAFAKRAAFVAPARRLAGGMRFVRLA